MIILNLIITRYFSFQNHRNQTYLWLQSSLLPVNFLRYSHNISTINTLIFILTMFDSLTVIFLTALQILSEALLPSLHHSSLARCLTLCRKWCVGRTLATSGLVLALVLTSSITLASHFTNLGYINCSVWTRSSFSKI